MAEPQESSATVKQTIISNVETPWLKAIHRRDFTEFERSRVLYEKQVYEKNKKPNTSIVTIFLESSIEDTDMQIFIAVEWVGATSINKFAEQQIGNCVKSQCKNKQTGEKLS